MDITKSQRLARSRNGKKNIIKATQATLKPCMDLTNRKIYRSIREASKCTGVCYNSISRCCLKKQKTAGKAKWIFINWEKV